MTLHKIYVRRIEELTLSYCITEVFDTFINTEVMKTSYRHSMKQNPHAKSIATPVANIEEDIQVRSYC